ncbi:unnamed protein product [Vitrella brassicaformis CCMP3155]|uniref:Palmitoyltransferase n=3 Tax=Vitrella brassicaformis TaxID=1169539 RepID=A0A0G4H4A5_VITBC|nr:unnamed protein product [Vitrella brassicaformis CCMP3155]|eukprot:CEM38589.1 unnamed protein product [Vitrella brassicaformis CCMP3155]
MTPTTPERRVRESSSPGAEIVDLSPFKNVRNNGRARVEFVIEENDLAGVEDHREASEEVQDDHGIDFAEYSGCGPGWPTAMWSEATTVTLDDPTKHLPEEVRWTGLSSRLFHGIASFLFLSWLFVEDSELSHVLSTLTHPLSSLYILTYATLHGLAWYWYRSVSCKGRGPGYLKPNRTFAERMRRTKEKDRQRERERETPPPPPPPLPVMDDSGYRVKESEGEIVPPSYHRNTTASTAESLEPQVVGKSTSDTAENETPAQPSSADQANGPQCDVYDLASDRDGSECGDPTHTHAHTEGATADGRDGRGAVGEEVDSIFYHVTASGEVQPPLHWCDICDIVQPRRAHHCRECGLCVATFDHHCFYVGGCVGELNHWKFYIFLWLSALCLVWDASLAFSAFHEKFYAIDWLKRNMLTLLIWGSLMVLVGITLGLLAYQTFLILTNQTTKEHMRRDRIDYLRELPPHLAPFSLGSGLRGMRDNFVDLFKRREPPIRLWEFTWRVGESIPFNYFDNETYDCGC